jgi:hypothetical protein
MDQHMRGVPKRAFFLIAITACLFAAQGWAQPTISSVAGSPSHGQTLTITGSAFGTKPTAAPVLWDTVDNISSYTGLSNGATIPMGGANPWPSPYGNSSGNNRVKYNTADLQRGVSTAQYKVTNANDGYLDGLTWAATNYAYVSWWWKTDTNVGPGDHSSKFLRMSNASDETGKTFSWNQQAAYLFNNPDYVGNVWVGFNGNPNSWSFFEAWFNSANQTWAVRVNGSYLANSTWTGAAFQFNELWRIGFDGGGNSPPSITWWMDDIYVDSSLARVMLGNASTYAGSRHFEMQIATAWSNSSVSVVVNQGSFGLGSAAYVYVVDASGAVNANGFPVTITSGVPAPPAPTALRVVQ